MRFEVICPENPAVLALVWALEEIEENELLVQVLKVCYRNLAFPSFRIVEMNE